MFGLLCPLDVFQEPLGVFPRLTFFGAIDTQTLRVEVWSLAQGPVVAKGYGASGCCCSQNCCFQEVLPRAKHTQLALKPPEKLPSTKNKSKNRGGQVFCDHQWKKVLTKT